MTQMSLDFKYDHDNSEALDPRPIATMGGFKVYGSQFERNSPNHLTHLDFCNDTNEVVFIVWSGYPDMIIKPYSTVSVEVTDILPYGIFMFDLEIIVIADISKYKLSFMLEVCENIDGFRVGVPSSGELSHLAW